MIGLSILIRYANRAKDIKNKPTVNEDPKDTMLRQYQEVCWHLATPRNNVTFVPFVHVQEITKLKMELAAKRGELTDAGYVVDGELILV